MFILSKSSRSAQIYDLQSSNSPCSYFPKFTVSKVHSPLFMISKIQILHIFQSSYLRKFILSKIHTLQSSYFPLHSSYSQMFSLSPKCILSKVNTLSKVHNLHSSYSPLHIHTLSPKFILSKVHTNHNSHLWIINSFLTAKTHIYLKL